MGGQEKGEESGVELPSVELATKTLRDQIDAYGEACCDLADWDPKLDEARAAVDVAVDQLLTASFAVGSAVARKNEVAAFIQNVGRMAGVRETDDVVSDRTETGREAVTESADSPLTLSPYWSAFAGGYIDADDWQVQRQQADSHWRLYQPSGGQFVGFSWDTATEAMNFRDAMDGSAHSPGSADPPAAAMVTHCVGLFGVGSVGCGFIGGGHASCPDCGGRLEAGSGVAEVAEVAESADHRLCGAVAVHPYNTGVLIRCKMLTLHHETAPRPHLGDYSATPTWLPGTLTWNDLDKCHAGYTGRGETEEPEPRIRGDVPYAPAQAVGSPPPASHPQQPIYKDTDGRMRFKVNSIVRWLVDSGPNVLQTLAGMSFTPEDRAQFTQLIGYSVDGFGELGFEVTEAIDAGIAATPEPEEPALGFEGAFCAVCGVQQFSSPAGLICDNGHNGADSISDPMKLADPADSANTCKAIKPLIEAPGKLIRCQRHDRAPCDKLGHHAKYEDAHGGKHATLWGDGSPGAAYLVWPDQRIRMVGQTRTPLSELRAALTSLVAVETALMAAELDTEVSR